MAKADSEDGRQALVGFCDAYYEPVVAYLKPLTSVSVVHLLREIGCMRE